ncbi:MAG: exopolysaccharide biosynthesis protein [bacterium]
MTNKDMHQPQQGELKTASLGQKLKVFIENLPPNQVTLMEIRDLIGQDGLLILTAFLTLVFMVPVSIPGVSTVFGFAILLVGISRLFDRNLWLPQRLASRKLSSEGIRSALMKGSKWLDRLDRVSRPHRMKWLVDGWMITTVNNGALILGAVLLMAPFGLIPFSNTLPGLALLFLAIGLLQRDGLCMLLGHLLNFFTMIYFAVLILGGGVAIKEVFQRLFGHG